MAYMILFKKKTKLATQRFGAGFTPPQRRGAGFTLIELIVYIAVLAVIGGAVASLFLWTVQAHTKSRVVQETTTGAQLALDTVLREVREAESLYLPTSTATQVSVKTANFTPVLEDTAFVDFFLCEDRLCMKKEGQSPVALTPDSIEVASLLFTYVSTDTEFPGVRVQLEARHRNPTGRSELSSTIELQGTASLR